MQNKKNGLASIRCDFPNICQAAMLELCGDYRQPEFYLLILRAEKYFSCLKFNLIHVLNQEFSRVSLDG